MYKLKYDICNKLKGLYIQYDPSEVFSEEPITKTQNGILNGTRTEQWNGGMECSERKTELFHNRPSLNTHETEIIYNVGIAILERK